MSESFLLSGVGRVKSGARDLGRLPYEVERMPNGQATIVKFAFKPEAENGEQLHLTLENGLMLDCRVVDASPYCVVIGEGPYPDRRAPKHRKYD